MDSQDPKLRGGRPLRVFMRVGLQAGFSLLVVIAGLELGMRLLGLGVPPRAPLSQAQNIRMAVPHEEAPHLWETLRPGGRASILYPGHGGRPDRTVTYEISAQGLRDRPVELPKPPGRIRIALIGDSVVYGTGVDLEDTLAKQLERELRALLPELDLEVLNCGVEATNTSQQLALLRYRLWAFEPDLLLWCVTIPDASGRNIQHPPDWGQLPAQRRLQRMRLTSGRWTEGELPDPWANRIMAVRRRSLLADTVAHQIYTRLQAEALVQSYRRDWSADSPGFVLVCRSLLGAAREAEARGVPMRVAKFPTLTRLDDGYPFFEEAQRLAAFCAQIDLPFLHLFEPLRGERARELHAHRHDRHPNARGHGLAAAYWARDLAPEVRALAHGNAFSAR